MYSYDREGGVCLSRAKGNTDLGEQNEARRCDVAVVGGGAAGLVAARAAAARGLSVAVIERSERCGKKLLITGKGRCNVINNCDVEQFMQKVRQGGRFL